MLSSNGQIEKAIHSHPTSASICKICAARSSELDVTRKERQEYLFPARQQPKSINFAQAVCRSVFDLCRSRSNDTRAMQTNFAGESKSPNRQLSFSIAIHMTIKRDNGCDNPTRKKDILKLATCRAFGFITLLSSEHWGTAGRTLAILGQHSNDFQLSPIATWKSSNQRACCIPLALL